MPPRKEPTPRGLQGACVLETEQDLISIRWQTVDCLDYGVKDIAGTVLIPLMGPISTDQARGRELGRTDNDTLRG